MPNPFKDFAFKVSKGSYAGLDTRVPRTLPQRLSDVVNVRDWGAVGNGSTPDTQAIQNAIDFCISQGGGTLYFPPGVYVCRPTALQFGTNNPAEKTRGIQILGNGGGSYDNTVIDSQGPLWAVSKGSRTYDLITRVEGISVLGSGGIRVEGSGVIIKHIKFQDCLVGVDASRANGCSISDCGGGGGDPPGDDASGNSVLGVPVSPPKVYSTKGVGLYLGNNCSANNCRLMGSYWSTYCLSGNGAAVIGGVSTERTYMACRVGWASDPDPTVIGGGIEATAFAATVTGLQTERQTITLELYNAVGCFISGNILTGGHDSSNEVNCSMSWSGGIVTVTSGVNHNIPSPKDLLVNANAGLSWSNHVVGTPTADPTKFTYPLAVAPSPTTTTGTWSYSPTYCVRVRKAHECIIAGNQMTVNAAKALVDLDYDGEAVHSNNLFQGVPGDAGWVPPVGKNAAGWTFINCGSLSLNGNHPNAVSSPGGNLLFANLPGQFTQTYDPVTGEALYQGGPFEGQEFDIKDGQKSGGGAATWGDTVVQGTSGRYKIRYTSGVWKRIG